MTRSFKFWPIVISLESVKLSTSNYEKSQRSTSACMVDYPERDVFGSHDLFTCWEISDNISETVQDRDTFAMKD